MLAIRMQRTGRKGHAQFRVVVQDSRFSPDSGRVVAYLGSYDPHAKTTTIDKEKAQSYLSNGARPSERVAGLLRKEGVELPAWVAQPAEKTRNIRNQDKLRRNRPVEEAAPATEETPAEPEEAAEASKEAPEVEEAVEADVSDETTAEEAPAEEAEAPAEEAPAADETPTES